MEDSHRGLAVRNIIELNHIGKAMAKGMKASVDGLALSQVSREIDLTLVIKQAKEIDIPFNTVIMAVVAQLLPRHPLFNAELVGEKVMVYEPINLGMAVSTDNGLIVVVLPGADQLNLQDLHEMIVDRSTRARKGKIMLTDIEGGTFTVSNLGMFGIDAGFSIPRPPESAILLIGTARPRPGVVDGNITICSICWFSLSYDHRFIDGVAAAQFLKDINDTCNSLERLGEVLC